MKKHPAVRPAIGTCLLLLVPLVMTLLDRNEPAGEGWHWDLLDFVVMGALLFGAGLAYELLARRFAARTQRVAIAGLILCAVLAVWVELAVGGVTQLVHWLAG